MKVTGIAKDVYPINTGKVLIGRDYIPKRTQYATRAEFFIQELLLSRRGGKVLLKRRRGKLFTSKTFYGSYPSSCPGSHYFSSMVEYQTGGYPDDSEMDEWVEYQFERK